MVIRRGPGAIVSAKVLVPVCPALSLIAIVRVKLPGSVGVPLRTPAVLRFRPGGGTEVSDHVYGGVPPIAVSVWVGYAVPTVPAGSGDPVTIVSLGASTVKVRLFEAVVPALSVT